jgi:nucleoside diphosphate kinase
MSDDTKAEAPDAVRKIIGAMVGQVVARCEREGIPLEDFYRVMLEEQKVYPKGTVAELFERTFCRLKAGTN